MAVEVIKNNWKPEFPKTIVCKNCGSILRVTDKNSFTQHTRKVKGTTSREKYLTLDFCPCCKEYDVEYEEVDVNITAELIEDKTPLERVLVNTPEGKISSI